MTPKFRPITRTLVVLLSLCSNSPLAAQWDFVTRPPTPSQNGNPSSHAANDYGHFIATATDLELIGNDGLKIAQIGGLSSTANVCVVTGTASHIAIITANGTSFNIRYTSPSSRFLRMAHKNVLTGLVPTVLWTQPILPNTGNINRLEAVLTDFGRKLRSSFIRITNSQIDLGATTGSLRQIQMNPANANNTGQFLEITHSTISTGWPTIVTPLHPAAGRTVPRSEILTKKPDHVLFHDNDIWYSYLEVRDPVSYLNFDHNDVYTAEKAIFAEWTSLFSSFSGSMLIENNIFYETWPTSNTSGQMTNIHIAGFNIPAFDNIIVRENSLLQTVVSDGITPALQGIFFDNGTNGDILYNEVRLRHNIGIHLRGATASRSFLCSNDIDTDPCCDPIDVGIQMDGTTSGYVKLNWVTNTGIGYYATDFDACNLILNSLDSNTFGARLDGSAVTQFNGVHTGGNDYGAFNYFLKNSNAQVAIEASATPYFGYVPLTGLQQNAAHNRFESVGSQVHIRSLNGPATLQSDWNLSMNEWSPAIATGTNQTNATLLPNITYDDALNITMANPGFTCGSGYELVTGSNGKIPQATGVAGDIPDSVRLFFKALEYDGNDPKRGRDTMMAYCEQHPFALSGDGHWLEGINWIGLFSNDFWHILVANDPPAALTYWQPIFNWYVKIQPYNDAELYQKRVLVALADCAAKFDRNLACNLFYNFTLRFPDDSSLNVNAWERIRAMRLAQLHAEEDTTAYSVLLFPLSTVSGVAAASDLSDEIQLCVSPNPVASSTKIRYKLPFNSSTDLRLFDASGRDVQQLLNSAQSAGDHTTEVNLESVATGSYFLRLSACGKVSTVPLLIER